MTGTILVGDRKFYSNLFTDRQSLAVSRMRSVQYNDQKHYGITGILPREHVQFVQKPYSAE